MIPPSALPCARYSLLSVPYPLMPDRTRISDTADEPRPSLAWFARPAVALADDLLGCRLVRTPDTGATLAGLIVETEAYIGVQDRASHAFAGRRTPRNDAMYARAGTAYVYFIYGTHCCFNVVCASVGEPAAVLVRALQPLTGLQHMHRARAAGRRRSTRSLFDTDLCSGQGKLCRALSIDRSLNGIDLLADHRLYILPRQHPIDSQSIAQSARIGIPSAGEWTSQPLRRYLNANPHVSRFRSSHQITPNPADPN